MSSWVGIPGIPPYVIPHGSAGLKKRNSENRISIWTLQMFEFPLLSRHLGCKNILSRAQLPKTLFVFMNYLPDNSNIGTHEGTLLMHPHGTRTSIKGHPHVRIIYQVFWPDFVAVWSKYISRLSKCEDKCRNLARMWVLIRSCGWSFSWMYCPIYVLSFLRSWNTILNPEWARYYYLS